MTTFRTFAPSSLDFCSFDFRAHLCVSLFFTCVVEYLCRARELVNLLSSVLSITYLGTTSRPSLLSFSLYGPALFLCLSTPVSNLLTTGICFLSLVASNSPISKQPFVFLTLKLFSTSLSSPIQYCPCNSYAYYFRVSCLDGYQFQVYDIASVQPHASFSLLWGCQCGNLSTLLLLSIIPWNHGGFLPFQSVFLLLSGSRA